MKLITKIGGKALLHRGGNGKILDTIPHLRHHRDDGLTLMERVNLRKTVNGLFTCGIRLKTNLVQKLQWQNSVTCKECTSYYRKLAAETIQIQQEERLEH